MNPNISADYQRMIHTMKYSRGGRETWFDSVNRLVDFLENQGTMTTNVYHYLNATVAPMMVNKQVVPSMRLLATAGPAAERENLMAFNCMFMGIKSWRDFGRLMYALMCGTGVGFSVEQQYFKQLLPEFYLMQGEPRTTGAEPIVFEDSREGWSKGFTLVILSLLYNWDVTWDVSKIRPKGTPLVTTGGYASGPEPLVELLEYTKASFHKWKTSGILLPVNVYDLCCKIADVVVQGGVRRSACICLFDHDDPTMWNAKSPRNTERYPHRFNSNNSVVFPDELVAREYLPEVLRLARETGEPGVVIKSTLTHRAKECKRIPKDNLGLNPCGEVILRDNQVCNLSEVICRPEDSLEDLMDKVEAAVFLGLLQARLTKFNPDFCKDIKRNTEEERLLGVSLTGLMDDPELTVGGHALDWLRQYAHEMARKWAPELGIKCPTAITCVKPSGTVSKLVNSSAGVHPRFSRYYLSNIGVAKGTPLQVFLASQKVPVRHETDTMIIYSFPLASPRKAITADDLSAIDQLNRWKLVNDKWCDHNASCTIYVGTHEWPLVEQWCLENTSSLAGVTFMSRFEATPGSYMPLEKLTKEAYDKAVDEFPLIAWHLFSGDSSLVGTREFACTGGSCDIVS